MDSLNMQIDVDFLHIVGYNYMQKGSVLYEKV